MKKYLFLFALCLIGALAMLILPSFASTLWQVDFASFTPPAGVSVTSQYTWDVGDHLVLYSRDSALTMTFNLPDGNYANYNLQITDRGTVINMAMAEQYASGVYSPYTLMINNATMAQDVDVMWLQDKTTTYNIGQYLKPGKNQITLTLNTGANTRYEIRKLLLIN